MLRTGRLAGAEGFEPSNTGSKVPRLTAWPRPIVHTARRGPFPLAPCFEKTPRSESCSHLAPVGGVGGSEPQDGPNHAARTISLSDGLIWRQVAQGLAWDAQRPITGAADCLRYDRPISAPGERAGRSFCPGSRIEETEYRRTAARHRRMSSAQSAQLGHDSSNLRVMGGHDRLEVVHDLPDWQRGLVGGTQARDSAPSRRSRDVEPTIGVLRADAKPGDHQRHPCGRLIDQREQQVATIEPQCGSPFEEKRHVGTQFARDLPLPFGRNIGTPKRRQTADRCRGIAAATAESRLHRYALHDSDDHVARLAATADGAPNLFGGAPDEVGAIYWALRIRYIQS